MNDGMPFEGMPFRMILSTSESESWATAPVAIAGACSPPRPSRPWHAPQRAINPGFPARDSALMLSVWQARPRRAVDTIGTAFTIKIASAAIVVRAHDRGSFPISIRNRTGVAFRPRSTAAPLLTVRCVVIARLLVRQPHRSGRISVTVFEKRSIDPNPRGRIQESHDTVTIFGIESQSRRWPDRDCLFEALVT